MFLKKIELTNFRNYQHLELSFDQITLLIGDNAQGKSNVLEAIYFLATSKSTRANRENQILRHNENFSTLLAEVEKGGDQEKIKLDIGIGFEPETKQLFKRLKVNGIPRKVVDYIGNLVVVLFAPEDINLVAGNPALRRWHIDLTLAQVDKEYKRALTEYSEVVISRNRVLKRIKEGLSNIDELQFWNGQSLALGEIVSAKRHSLFDFLNQASHNTDFKFLYQTSLLSAQRLKEYQAKEVAAATCLIGPHRDDFKFMLQDLELAHFGSRGEQRSAVLDLKLLELKYINQIKDTQPVLLLDDVFSELDDAHRDHVIAVTRLQQTIVTAVANEAIPEAFLESAKVIRVENGAIFET